MIPTPESKKFKLPYERIYNFSAGPGTLPVEVLEQARDELLNWQGTGMSVLEMSHRGNEYEGIHTEALANLRKLMNVPDDWAVLFMQGGASIQNALVPLNLKQDGRTPNYIDTGTWGNKSLKDARKLCEVHVAYTSEESGFDRAPADDEPRFSGGESYVYFTSNETIGGVDFLRDPNFGVDAPVVCDMSSNILSRPIDLTRYDVIFAGAQKNQGPAGVGTVIISPRALEIAQRQDLPLMLSWKAVNKEDSIHNTPPCFTIYMCGLYYKWLLGKGGVEAIRPVNERKAKLVYDVIDASGGFYKGHAVKENRSLMNITFRCPSEELDGKFLKEARDLHMSTLAGHRSTRGIRASMYNAFPEDGAVALAEFMSYFAKRNA